MTIFANLLQCIAAVLTLLLSVFIWVNTRKIPITQYMQTVQYMWLTYNQTVLPNEELVKISQKILCGDKLDLADPKTLHVIYMVLNILEAQHFGMSNRLVDYELYHECGRDILKPLLLANRGVITIVEKGGYHKKFCNLCNKILENHPEQIQNPNTLLRTI